jgi:hypothetical protein
MKLNFYFTGIIFTLIIFFGFFGIVKSSEAAVDLPWSTTFDCDEWNNVEDGYGPTGCDGVQGGSSAGSSITSEANMTNGLGGLGYRQTILDGVNINSGPFYMTFSSGQDELWVRWYMRYQVPFTWGGSSAPYPYYHKLLYVDVRTPYSNPPGQYIIPELEGDYFRIVAWNPSGSEIVYSAAGEGWPVIGDGEWHCLEVHLTKTGTYQMWVDEKLIIDETNVKTLLQDFTIVEFGTNQEEPDNGAARYVDWDDVVINNTGYIGPIESSDTTPPSAPSGLGVS